jgi:co-chaperonin GroES (HSP10)
VPSALKKSDPILDEKEAILSKLGDLSQVQIAQNEVLVAIYIRPEKSAGGILLTDRTRKEDNYQGKVGLVVKIGSACRFVREETYENKVTGERIGTGRFYGVDVQLHDWIVTRPSDTWPLDMNGGEDTSDPKAFTNCRLVFDDQIRMKIPQPGMIW